MWMEVVVTLLQKNGKKSCDADDNLKFYERF